MIQSSSDIDRLLDLLDANALTFEFVELILLEEQTHIRRKHNSLHAHNDMT